ncbi:MAG: AAA family ATPase [Deltaproteobacteria bacterium]|nr:AAA family ATPase [Deltaproteobacteria bacterium]
MAKKRIGFRELSPDELRWRCDPGRFGFESTRDVEACQEIIGQPRATEAIRVGLEIEGFGYNIFVTGLSGTGRTTTIKRLLQEVDRESRIPEDLCYVNNFKDPDTPRIIVLPAGQGLGLKRDMDSLVEGLRREIPLVFESEAYQKRRKETTEKWQEKQADLWSRFEKEVKTSGFSVVQFKLGSYLQPGILPVVDGKPTDLAEVEALREKGKLGDGEVKKIKRRHRKLTETLQEVLKETRRYGREIEEAVRRLNRETLGPLVKEMVSDIREKYVHPKVQAYLDGVEEAVLQDFDRFQGGVDKKPDPADLSESLSQDPFLEFRVNVLVDNSETRGAPIVVENFPTYRNLFGTLERVVGPSGVWKTDFTRIKAGSLIRANGGYLIINAHDALIEPRVWTTLKRTLKNRSIQIQTYDPIYLMGGTALKPEPIELKSKIIMIGDNRLYHLLYELDEDFKKIFKVKADFDSVMDRMDQAVNQYASFVCKICREENLRPFHRTGVAAIVEHGVRLAGRQDKLSTRFHVISDVMREADYWAAKAGSETVREEHVDLAIEKRAYRVNMVEEKIREMIRNGTIMVDSEGEVVGQVNGLAMYQLGDHRFGKPSRITAKTAMGRAGIINIEREADLSGKTHNKGVLILAGYLRGKYAQDKPLTMSASICFEQSYTGVDGDSASSTEVYALLSSLSGLPLRQDIAVTGSVNQRGEIQPIGGVNEKIEGFFDVCRIRGLTGKQGAIIPDRNVKDLMLRKDVVEAVRAGQFHIYPVRSIDEGMEILTGVAAGAPVPKGGYTPGSANDLIDRRLRDLAEKMRDFGRPRKSKNGKGEREQGGKGGKRGGADR